MTMLTHARSPHMLPTFDARAASVSIGVPHLAMIWRFFKFALTMLACVAAIAGVMAIRVVAWFPPFHQ